MRTCHEAQQHEPLAKAAHALKSMSLNIGARRVAQLAGQIEKEARGSVLPPHATVEQLGRLFDEACLLLQSEAEISAAA